MDERKLTEFEEVILSHIVDLGYPIDGIEILNTGCRFYVVHEDFDFIGEISGDKIIIEHGNFTEEGHKVIFDITSPDSIDEIENAMETAKNEVLRILRYFKM